MSNDHNLLTQIGALGTSSGAGHVTAAAAIYFASRAAARPLSGLLAAAFLADADTDTLASLVGGLLGAIHGTSWLKDLASVQNAAYLCRIALDLIQREPSMVISPQASMDTSVAAFMIELIEKDQRTGVFPDGRTYEVSRKERLPGTSPMLKVEVRLDDGQTAFIDHKLKETITRLVPSTNAAQPSPVTNAPGRTQVTLVTPNINRIAQFYSKPLSRDVIVRDN
jgi:hypothetical protein